MSTGSGRETQLDPNRTTHLGIWRDEHDNLTRRFFHWEVPALPAAVRAALDRGVDHEAEGLNLENVDELLRPGYLAFETGVARCANGELSVAVHTDWPAATGEMIDWWFGWHIERTERYKLWHPQAHLFAQPRHDYSTVDDISDRERYVGNTSWVDEYIGPFVSRLAITFHDPGDIGLDATATAAAGYGTVVAATTADSDTGEARARLIHAVRHIDGGAEMRSRFILPSDAPEIVGHLLLDHCWTEMTHLARFLPDLHAQVAGATATV